MPKAVKLILKILGWAAGLVVVVILLIVGFVQMRWDAADGRPVPELKAPTDSASIARGEYIFKYQSQCWGCHAGMTETTTASASGGRLFDLTDVGPGFGKWYSRNLTSDTGTGLGSWTDGQIVQALREGLNKDRATLFPIMPVDWYHGMADDDVLAVVAYLRSLPPVKNAVPAREPSFATKALFTFGLMKPKDAVTAPIAAPPKGVTPEYGRYLARHLAGCADCHTPRNLEDGQFYMDSLFAGSSFPFGGGEEDPIASFARNITPDMETGIGSWTEEQFIMAVTSGMRPDGTVLSAHMPYPYYKFWGADDLRAVFAYLMTVPARKRTVPPNESDASLVNARGAERGGLLFKSRCQMCHGENGRGAEPTNVKLAEVAPSLSDADLVEFVKSGQLDLKMPAFGKTLKDPELADIVAFIRTWEKK